MKLVSLLKKARIAGLVLLTFLITSFAVHAQSYTFTNVQIEGNQRVEPGTILTYAGISRGERVSAGRLNDAYQNILGSGLFEKVEIVPSGSTLIIRVQEFPTINRISIEGNRRIKDEQLLPLIRSQPRRVYSPTTAEQDASTITQAYAQAGRFAATVTPSIIRRSDNRVDLVFDISESSVIEIERISFTGNRNYSDRRLRRVLGTKQAGLLRQLIGRDTYVEDRIEFDKQLLRDFYLSRGYVDFQTLSVTSELTRERDGFIISFNVREGQSFKFGQVRAVSLIDDVDEEEFQKAINIRPGITYSPTAIETVIARMERLALKKGLNFVRVQPNVKRNDRDLTLDIDFEISRGPRVFVERIDIEGNTTTLDRVVRRQFRIVEGDPFNPREIRQSAERVRALGLFANVETNVREGSSPESVIVDVDVEEQSTGSLNFGANYNQNDGIGLAVGFSERNFLGRGQSLSFGFNTSADNASYNFGFAEPAFLGRDLRFGIDIRYATSNGRFSDYDTTLARFSPSLAFPVSENGRLSVRYALQQDEISDVEEDSSELVKRDGEAGALITSSIGYTYSFDNRVTGLNPNAGILFRFSQDIAGLGGDREYLRTVAFLGAQTAVLNEEVTLRAIFEGGAINTFDGDSRITDRFSGNGKIRGFEPNGYGPRDLSVDNEDAVYGNMFAALRLEADFPLPLPEEYGISGGAFFDVGSVWDLDDNLNGAIDDDLIWRSSIGLSFLWTTPLGPLRFNFAQPLSIEDYDNPQYFDLSISTSF